MSAKIIDGDCVVKMSEINEKSVRLAISSPPYGVGKSYEIESTMEEYLAWMKLVVKQLSRVLVDGGSICWQVGNYVKDGVITPLDFHFWQMFSECGFQLRNRIIWTFGHGLHCSKRLSGRYEVLLWLTKGLYTDYTFNLDPIRIAQKYPNKKHYTGDRKGELSCNPLGKNPGDVWNFMLEEWESGVWDIPNVKHNHPEKTAHPCQFPMELAERCVLAFSNEGDTILDPFGGVGTTALAAEKHGRNGISIERVKEYNVIARERLEQLKCGTLKTRPIGKIS